MNTPITETRSVMGKHIDDFAIFAAAILDKLYDSFPLPIGISPAEFIELPNVLEMLAALDRVDQATPETQDAFAKSTAAAKEAKNISNSLAASKQKTDILFGTLDFLIAEGYVRCTDAYPEDRIYRGCQLTAKGFSHLHKEFKDGALSSKKATIIQAIKERFSNAASLEGAILAGIISKFLG